MTFKDQRYVPGVYTKPLSEDFVSDGPWLREFCQRYIKEFDGKPFKLDEWQADLLDHILERYPADWPVERLRGRLRYREVVVSMGRQNGKSIIGAVLGLYGLFQPGAYVVGVASNRKQADIVFARVKKIIDKHPQLKKRLKTTHTRGITRLDRPAIYEAYPAKPDALNGLPVTLCLFDEVHLCEPDMWSHMVEGTTAQADAFVFGITTAGNSSSVLLKDLYNRGRASAASEDASDERLGFFLWEAPANCRLDDTEALKDANPALAAGRLDMDEALRKVSSQPEAFARQFRFNQFQESQGFWLPMPLWQRNTGAAVPIGEERTIIFGVDRSESWEYATITANYKDADGVIHTKVVASLRKPNLEWLTNVCVMLYERHYPKGFVMEDGFILGDLVTELKNRGIPCTGLKQYDRGNAAETFYALISTGRIRHASDPLLSQQLPVAQKKDTDGGWIISRKASKGSIDAVLATVWGTYAAEKDLAYVSSIAA